MLYHRLKCDAYALVRQFGAHSRIGHRAHNLVEMLKNFVNAGSDEQREHLRKGLRRTAIEIDQLRR